MDHQAVEMAMRLDRPSAWSNEQLFESSVPDAVLDSFANDNRQVLEHEHVLFNNATHRVDASSWFERVVADTQIKQQSRQIAFKLSESGFDPYLKSDRHVSMVGLVSGAVLPLSTYRNVNILPEVAQRNRQPLVAEFQLFLKENPKYRRYARYTVVSSGRHFPLEDFPDRLKLFNESIRQFLAKCKRRDIECLFVGLEFTLDKANMVNLHANIITSPNKAFGPTGWPKWLKTMREHFGDFDAADLPPEKEAKRWVRDAGRLKDVKEVIKYVCKYGDIASLSGQETKFLADVFYKRQLIRPLGAFLRWRRQLHNDGQKVRFDHASKALVRCQVSRRKRAENDDWTEEELRADIDATNAAAARQERIESLSRSGGLRERDVDEPVENQILCTTLPQTRVGIFAEPFAVVVNFTDDPSTKNGRDGLKAVEARRRHHYKILAEHCVEECDLAAAGRSILDTLTITSRALSDSYFLISKKRRERLREALGLVENPLSQHVESAVWDFLDRHLPKKRVEWSLSVSDDAQLLAEGAEAQESFGARVPMMQQADADLAAYLASRDPSIREPVPGLYDFDAEDFAIPY